MLIKNSIFHVIKKQDNRKNSVDVIRKLPKAIYYVESDDDYTVLVGINIVIKRYKMGRKTFFIIRWYDTSHDRIMLASRIEYINNAFIFKRIKKEGGGIYRFTPMDVDTYNERVRPYLFAAPRISSIEELEDIFFKTHR